MIWYQGEANGGRAAEYRKLLPTLISNWALSGGAEVPFLVVQLAPWHAGNAEGVNWAELRRLNSWPPAPSQGRVGGHHRCGRQGRRPPEAKPVGERLALAGLAIAYGEKLEYSGPVYKAASFEGDQAILTFDHVGGGLVCKGEKLTGFSTAGEDRVFHPAVAEIKGDTVVVALPTGQQARGRAVRLEELSGGELVQQDGPAGRTLPHRRLSPYHRTQEVTLESGGWGCESEIARRSQTAPSRSRPVSGGWGCESEIAG